MPGLDILKYTTRHLDRHEDDGSRPYAAVTYSWGRRPVLTYTAPHLDRHEDDGSRSSYHSGSVSRETSARSGASGSDATASDASGSDASTHAADSDAADSDAASDAPRSRAGSDVSDAPSDARSEVASELSAASASDHDRLAGAAAEGGEAAKAAKASLLSARRDAADDDASFSDKDEPGDDVSRRTATLEKATLEAIVAVVSASHQHSPPTATDDGGDGGGGGDRSIGGAEREDGGGGDGSGATFFRDVEYDAFSRLRGESAAAAAGDRVAAEDDENLGYEDGFALVHAGRPIGVVGRRLGETARSAIYQLKLDASAGGAATSCALKAVKAGVVGAERLEKEKGLAVEVALGFVSRARRRRGSRPPCASVVLFFRGRCLARGVVAVLVLLTRRVRCSSLEVRARPLGARDVGDRAARARPAGRARLDREGVPAAARVWRWGRTRGTYSAAATFHSIPFPFPFQHRWKYDT